MQAESERARAFAKKLNAPIAIIDKRRSAHNVSEVYHIIGDVKGHTAILVDDMIDTAGTIRAGTSSVERSGAATCQPSAAHPGCSLAQRVSAYWRVSIEEMVVTNSIPLSEAAQALPNIVQLSIAPLMAEAIGRIHDHQSVSEMFERWQRTYRPSKMA
jgi:ribose-phosphate pyrophosphokinase